MRSRPWQRLAGICLALACGCSSVGIETDTSSDDAAANAGSAPAPADAASPPSIPDAGPLTPSTTAPSEVCEKRTVQAGPLSAGFREIRSGLNGGELVVTGGVAAPEAGMRVTTSP